MHNSAPFRKRKSLQKINSDKERFQQVRMRKRYPHDNVTLARARKITFELNATWSVLRRDRSSLSRLVDCKNVGYRLWLVLRANLAKTESRDDQFHELCSPAGIMNTPALCSHLSFNMVCKVS